MMILCVLKSGGQYDASWVKKLRDGVHRNTTSSYRFVCLSDVDFSIDETWKPRTERIPLKHGWPGWWSKIEMFSPGIITEPCLYLDLDTVITGNIDHLLELPYDFAMLRNFHEPDFVGSGVMWFKNENSVPHKVYQKFLKMPECYIQHHERRKNGSHLGDQAFIWDTLGGDIKLIDTSHGIRSFKYHCRSHLPPETSVVCFHGTPRPNQVEAEWITRHWT